MKKKPPQTLQAERDKHTETVSLGTPYAQGTDVMAQLAECLSYTNCTYYAAHFVGLRTEWLIRLLLERSKGTSAKGSCS